MDAAMTIFDVSKRFPREEKYSLVDQIRRSSRSVAANLAEAWRKRRYEGAFVAKLNDCEGEAAETQTWIEFGRRCGYLNPRQADELDERYETLLGQIVKMISNPDVWTLKRSGN
jgi:four helix bundle protein